MKNLLRTELFRIVRSKAFWICLGIGCCLSLVNVLLQAFAYDIMISVAGTSEGVVAPVGDVFASGLTGGGSGALLFAMIFATVFIVREFSQNTIRNYMVSGNCRHKIFLSKTIALLLSTFVVAFASMLTAMLTELFSSANFEMPLWEFAVRALTAYAALAALVCLMSFLAVGLRKSVPVFAIGYGATFLVAIIALFAQLAYDSFNWLNVFEYLLLVNNMTMATSMNLDWVYGVMVGVTVIAGAGYYYLGTLIFSRIDLK